MTELHGGSVSLTSEVGQGSRFSVLLPWDGPNGDGRFPNQTAPVTAVLPSAGGKTILLAEDNEIFIETITDYLEAKGYTVQIARNGREALAQAQSDLPDLILMDIQMPEMDGLQAIERLRAAEQTAVVPIVALTALAMPGDEERCLAAGANAYLSKPLSLKQLIRLIESFPQKEEQLVR